MKTMDNFGLSLMSLITNSIFRSNLYPKCPWAINVHGLSPLLLHSNLQSWLMTADFGHLFVNFLKRFVRKIAKIIEK